MYEMPLTKEALEIVKESTPSLRPILIKMYVLGQMAGAQLSNEMTKALLESCEEALKHAAQLSQEKVFFREDLEEKEDGTVVPAKTKDKNLN